MRENDSKDIILMSGKTDERNQGEWKSRYTERKAIVFQIIEAVYLFILVILSFILLLLNHIGIFEKVFDIPEIKQLYLSRVFICVICGLLGGTIFDIKWFYKSIAHGFWNVDRFYWRFFTPIISMSFAFGMACILSNNIVLYGNGFSAATIGFLAGYFSDEAVGKMAEVAKVLFNTNKDSSEDSRDNERHDNK